MGKSCLEDSINECLVRWAKLARARFNGYDIEVEFSGDDVSANILDNPIVIVSLNWLHNVFSFRGRVGGGLQAFIKTQLMS